MYGAADSSLNSPLRPFSQTARGTAHHCIPRRPQPLLVLYAAVHEWFPGAVVPWGTTSGPCSVPRGFTSPARRPYNMFDMLKLLISFGLSILVSARQQHAIHRKPRDLANESFAVASPGCPSVQGATTKGHSYQRAFFPSFRHFFRAIFQIFHIFLFFLVSIGMLTNLIFLVLQEDFTYSDRTPPYIDTYLQLFPTFGKLWEKRSPIGMNLIPVYFP